MHYVLRENWLFNVSTTFVYRFTLPSISGQMPPGLWSIAPACLQLSLGLDTEHAGDPAHEGGKRCHTHQVTESSNGKYGTFLLSKPWVFKSVCKTKIRSRAKSGFSNALCPPRSGGGGPIQRGAERGKFFGDIRRRQDYCCCFLFVLQCASPMLGRAKRRVEIWLQESRIILHLSPDRVP